MKSSTVARAAAAMLVVGGLAASAALWAQTEKPKPQGAEEAKPAGEFRLSGPYSHENLTIFLIHGQDRLKNKNFLTLPEALEQKKFVIHETQNVNQLSMENLSATQEVLILAGDILSGGRQDRVVQHDLVIPPKSGKVPLPAFCVERTAPRWYKPRGEASEAVFKDSKDQLASRNLRLAARYAKDQGKVWDEVTNTQRQLSANTGKSVQAKESDSSLQLTLEDKEVRAATGRYIEQLSGAIKDKEDVIGFAFAINGKMNSADVYGSGALFRKVWPRLLKATATEAFADWQKGKKFEPVNAQMVRAFLAEADRGKASSQEVTPGTQAVTREAATNVLFETRQRGQESSLIRRNYIAK
jgi:hypothetical protein